MRRFENKVVIITGAGQGMGRACGHAFSSEGATVAFVDVKTEEIERAANRARSNGGRAISITCDVSKVTDVNRTAERVVTEFGTVDVLVNNAGILLTTTPLERIEEEEWDRVINVNLKGMYLFSRAVLPIMRKKTYGKIINISSSAGRSTSELGGSHYTVSKTAVLGLTRHTAREYGSYGINVNAICPGLVETTMIRDGASNELLEGWLKQIPMGRFAQPEEEAELVLFLASEQSAYITGATIDFNGGSLLM